MELKGGEATNVVLFLNHSKHIERSKKNLCTNKMKSIVFGM